MDFLKNHIAKMQQSRPKTDGNSWVKKGDLERERQQKYLEEQKKREEERKKKQEQKDLE